MIKHTKVQEIVNKHPLRATTYFRRKADGDYTLIMNDSFTDFRDMKLKALKINNTWGLFYRTREIKIAKSFLEEIDAHNELSKIEINIDIELGEKTYLETFDAKDNLPKIENIKTMAELIKKILTSNTTVGAKILIFMSISNKEILKLKINKKVDRYIRVITSHESSSHYGTFLNLLLSNIKRDGMYLHDDIDTFCSNLDAYKNKINK